MRHKGGGIVRDLKFIFRSGVRDDLEEVLGGRVGRKRNVGVSERVKNETVGKRNVIFFRQKGGGMKKGTRILQPLTCLSFALTPLAFKK